MAGNDTLTGLNIREENGALWLSTSELAAQGSSRYFSSVKTKESIKLLGLEHTFTPNSPFVSVNGVIYSLGLPTRVDGDDLMVPLSGLLGIWTQIKGKKYYVISNEKKSSAVAAPAPVSSQNKSVTNLTKPKNKTHWVIGIDPGHGGKDSGAMGPTGLREKDVVLKIALKIKKLARADPNISVLLTRETDHFIPLGDRGGIVMSAGADIFISIHCNASGVRSARGAECFYLSPAKTDEAHTTAALENAAALLEENPSRYGSDADLIVTDFMQSQFVRESSYLALLLENAIVSETGTRNRGTQGAGFYVLRDVLAPAVLVETGFISNPEDERLLGSDEYENKLAKAILKGAQDFVGAFHRETTDK